MAVFWYDVIRDLFAVAGGREKTEKGVDVPGNDCHSSKQIVGEWFVSGPNMAPLMANAKCRTNRIGK